MTRIIFDDPLTAREDRNVRNISRIARMLKVKRDSPYANTTEYDSSIEDYKYFWRRLTKEDKAKAREHALRIADLSIEDIDAALETLGD